MFDLAVNGGGLLTVKYEKTGFLEVQRQERVPWQDYCLVPDVVMIGHDSRVTHIDLNANIPIQVARANSATDSDGVRQATLLFRQGTTAMMVLADGSTQPLTNLHVRATEYTVGPNGPATMPAELPATSAYTYAVEFNTDEAVAAGARNVLFSQPVINYVENFLNFPAGTIVPAGSYDRGEGRWVSEDNGRVVRVLSITGGVANLDVTGNGQPAGDADYAALGITVAERQRWRSLSCRAGLVAGTDPALLVVMGLQLALYPPLVQSPQLGPTGDRSRRRPLPTGGFHHRVPEPNTGREHRHHWHGFQP